MRIVRPMVRTLGGVSERVRDLARLQEVARILVRHGFGIVVAGSGLPGLPHEGDATFRGTPERALAAIEELGPTYVKLGQVMSTRPDALPLAYVEAFQSLQDDVEPLTLDDVDKVLQADLGVSWRDELSEFDDTPLATASIAQVHRAVLRDGRQVVLKVQRPGIRKKITADLHILAFLAQRMLNEFPETRALDPLGILSEFELSISAELDFIKEAEHMRRMTRNFEGSTIVVIPEVIDELTTARVLCMEYLEGVKMRDARAAGCDMKVVGDRYLEAAYDMLFVHGFFHGDLHPGNVIVLENDVLGLIDFGMVGRLNTEMRNNVISIMFALQRGDFRTIARLFYEIAIKDDRVDYAAVERDTVEVMEAHWAAGSSVRDMQLGAFFMDLGRKAARHGARIPSTYSMFFKAIVTSEGLAKSLIEEVDPIAAVQPYFDRMLAERVSPQRLQQDLFYASLTMQTLASRVPVAVSQLLDDFDAQRLQLNIRLHADDRQLESTERLSTRNLFAAFTITAAICGTLATTMGGFITGWIVGVIFYGLMAVFFGLTAWMVITGPGRQ